MNEHEKFMKMALGRASTAAKQGETPVGCVIVKDGRVISGGRNRRENGKNALCHAEISAINAACKKLGGWRLPECDMYVTMEPCPMCCGAILQARIKNVYFGTYSRENGCMGTVVNLPKQLKNNSLTVYGGIMEDECTKLLTDFEYTGK